jgi:mRNA-degrading endonuclease toxin of MazEF toxin-antitoxin module
MGGVSNYSPSPANCRWFSMTLLAIDQIRTISKQRLKKKIDKLSKIKAAQLRKLITDMYGE